MKTLMLVASLTLSLTINGTALAQSYPSKPVRLVIPYPAGGSNDILARIFAAKLTETLGQQVVVDNRPGAGATIGTAVVAKAPPDGYTLLMASLASHATSPHMNSNVGYDAVRDFAPITLLAKAPVILVVSAQFPANNLKDVLAAVRQNPGKFTYGSAGNGSPPHLAAEIFKAQTTTDLLHVPFKGGTQHLVDLQAGRIDMIFDPTISSMSFVKSGKVRPLAIASATRSAEVPDVPTFAEAGLPGFEVYAWYGIVAPAGTPKDIIARLNSDLTRILTLPDVRTRLQALSVEPATESAEQFGEFIRAEYNKYGKVIREGGIKAE